MAVLEAFNATKAWYLKTTQPEAKSFKTMFLASALAKGNVALTAIIGSTLAGLAIFLGDTWPGAFTKLAVWVFFVLGLCALAARNHAYFSFVELDKARLGMTDRLIFAALNFVLMSVWAITFLSATTGLAFSFAYSAFIFFVFAPKKEETEV
ncbi:MAG: hypothetical protein AAFW47_01000 [Pseudomonadota bacterium]